MKSGTNKYTKEVEDTLNRLSLKNDKTKAAKLKKYIGTNLEVLGMISKAQVDAHKSGFSFYSEQKESTFMIYHEVYSQSSIFEAKNLAFIFLDKHHKHIPLKTQLKLLLPLMILFIGMNIGKSYADNNEVENHERWYQVEMIIFARAENNPQEAWPKDIKLAYPNNLVAIKSSSNDSDGFNVLEPGERKLNSQAAAIVKNGSYTLLFHQAWKQMIYGRKTNIAISGGKTFNGHQELEGSIALSVGQYLKIQSNLWLTQFVPAGTNLTETWPELPMLPNTSAAEADKAQDYLIKRIVKMSQERSMRSNEVHYIDHPLLGVIIKIIPVETPSTKTN